MIYDNDTKKDIRNIVRKNHILFLLETAGKDFLTDDDLKFIKDMGIDPSDYLKDDYIDDAYNVGLTRSNVKAGEQPNIPLEQFRAEPKPYVSEEAKYAVDHVRSQVATSTGKQVAKIQDDIEAAIRNGNLQFANFVMDEPTASVVERGLAENRTRQQIQTDLQDKFGEYNRDWRRIVVTELNNARNHGAAENFRQLNRNKKSEEILVYKIVVEDAAACEKCVSLYMRGGQPRVFTLKQLRMNGTNHGKKAKDWLPVIGSTHPNCRCFNNMLPDGFGFDKDGNMEFKNSEYKHPVEK